LKAISIKYSPLPNAEYIDLKILISQTFFNAYYSSTGHPRGYSLSSMLTALIVQKILGLSETKNFLNILSLSKETHANSER